MSSKPDYERLKPCIAPHMVSIKAFQYNTEAGTVDRAAIEKFAPMIRDVWKDLGANHRQTGLRGPSTQRVFPGSRLDPPAEKEFGKQGATHLGIDVVRLCVKCAHVRPDSHTGTERWFDLIYNTCRTQTQQHVHNTQTPRTSPEHANENNSVSSRCFAHRSLAAFASDRPFYASA